MSSDLQQFIANLSICDTHEHMKKEQDWLDFKPDLLCELFQNYVPADLVVAGASAEALKRLLDPNEPDIEKRFEGVRTAWEAVTHTGYGEAGNLCGLLARYPKARFVLMHIAYPYDDEIVALAKHYPNVWVDMCWAWSINPHASAQFVRRFLHAAPVNKLFGFGGDTSRPRAAVAYALQCRKWLTKALQAEVDEGELTEAQAIAVARRLLQENQGACFDLEGVRRRISEQMARER